MVYEGSELRIPRRDRRHARGDRSRRSPRRRGRGGVGLCAVAESVARAGAMGAREKHSAVALGLRRVADRAGGDRCLLPARGQTVRPRGARRRPRFSAGRRFIPISAGTPRGISARATVAARSSPGTRSASRMRSRRMNLATTNGGRWAAAFVGGDHPRVWAHAFQDQAERRCRANDRARLRRIAEVIGREASACRFTLDGNENFHAVAPVPRAVGGTARRSRRWPDFSTG